MNTDELARQLHDKATRGEALTAEEQAQLSAWYARQDEEEAALLNRSAAPRDLTALQAQIDGAVARLVETTQKIQSLTAENEAVRRDIADLQRRLVQKPAKQPV